MMSLGAQKGIALVGLLAALSACTAMRPPNAYMPDRSGIEAGETITVKGNENVYVIAQKHNISMRELIVLNDLKPPYVIRPGQSLVLPATGSSFAGEMTPPAASPLAPVEKNALMPISPSAVSEQPLAPIAAPPPMSNVKTGIQSAAPPAAPPPAAIDLVQSLNQPAPAQRPTETTAPSVSVASAAASATDDSQVSMKWPVQGPILSTFGSKGAGLNNDGINIGAPKGAPVVAAAPGTVVYAGDEMKGFGNLILIRHQGDLVTAYSHLDRVMVKKDTIVGQGDMIGTVGKTGNVPSPQLHFEVRQDGKPVDPTKVIKSAL